MYFSSVIDLIRSRLAKHLSLLFFGNMLAATVGFITMLVIARGLTVAEYGLFNVAVSVMVLASQLASLGTHTAMTTFASRCISEGDRGGAAEVFRVTLYVITGVGVVISIVIFLSSGLIASVVFGDDGLSALIGLSAFGVLAGAIGNYLRNALNSLIRYRESVVMQVLTDVAKLAIIGLLAWLISAKASYAVAAFAFAPVAGALYGFKKLKSDIFTGPAASAQTLSKLLDYSKWTFASNILVLLSPHVGIFMLSRMMGSEAAGVYGLALNLTYVFPILVYSLHSVLMPEVSRFNDPAQFHKYLKSILKITAAISVIIVPLMFLSGKIIPYVFGHKYAASVEVFNWLLLAFMMSSISVAIRVIYYAMNRPHVLTLLDGSKLTLLVIGCYIFIPSLGVATPAMLGAVINIFVIGILIYMSFKTIRRWRP